MNLSIVFRVINIIVAAFLVIGGVMTLLAGGKYPSLESINEPCFPNFIQGIFVIIFGVMTAVFEFRLPAIITQFASFMFSFMGRGICNGGFKVLAFGVIYIVLHFFRNIDAPSNMQKRAYEDAVGYSTQVNDTPSPNFQSGGYPQPGVGGQPTYPSANYANPGAV
ncbi:hypothetical protein FB192DRAFT_1288428 [Mucor lusitanicus]|uniref:Uncharacterized protein n=1 Tax=Mucor circinelloides f. lusitanicus TaxID=29924 RepID=A0A8H4BBT6_MUCCL|nr:hypothetical protein FB192DRAFT_1288428 [Mucor lusitanicus]